MKKMTFYLFPLDYNAKIILHFLKTGFSETQKTYRNLKQSSFQPLCSGNYVLSIFLINPRFLAK